MQNISVADAREKISQLLKIVEQVVIQRYQKPVAYIISYAG